jgi:hypothetical protein
MKSFVYTLFDDRSNITVNVGLTLVALMSVIFVYDYYGSHNSSFAQTDSNLSAISQFNLTNNNGVGIQNQSASSPTLNQSLTGQQPPSGFVADGKVNTVITVPKGKWLAAGPWHITLSNGNVTSFDTNMTWYNSSGTNAHTHELTNLRPSVDGQPLSLKKVNKDIIIEGVTDVGANNKISWFAVPTTITLRDERILSILVDDTKTNHHFGGQPLLGIVDSYRPCSDLPGANMEILPACTETTAGPQSLGLTNETAGGEFGTFGNQTGGEFGTFGNQTGGEFGTFGNQTGGEFGGGEFQGQAGGGSVGGGEFQGQAGGGSESGGGESALKAKTGGGSESGGGESALKAKTGGGSELGGGESAFKAQTGNVGVEKADDFGGEFKPECTALSVENITASGFESDPADTHPPSDAIDGNSSTWWSSNGKDSWVDLNVGQPSTICGLSIEWNKGDKRDYSFKVGVSNDGNEYKDVLNDKNKKGSSVEQIYPIKETDGQFIKLTITGTSSNDGWTSIKEIKAIGIPPAGGEQLFPAFGNQTGSQVGGEQLFPAFGNQTGTGLP